MIKRFTHIVLYTLPILFIASCAKKGCTDANASNYSAAAKKNNGSCIYNPGIKLIGADTLFIPLGGTYFEEGAVAIDSDGKKPLVLIENQVNTTKKGNYQIRYFAELQSGIIDVSRNVIVAVDRSNWVGTWKTHSDCGAMQLFHPDSLMTFVEGDQSNLVQTTDMLYYAPNTLLQASVYLDQIDMKKQYVQYTFANSYFTAHGNMNEDGSAFKLTVDYDFPPGSYFYSSFPRICELVYTKVE